MRSGKHLRYFTALLLALGTILLPHSAAHGAGASCSGQRKVVGPRGGVPLCSEIVLEGSRTGVIRVRLPFRARISETFGPEGDIDIRGDSRLVGFVLVQDAVSGGAGLFVGRLPGEANNLTFWWAFGTRRDFGPRTTLPAGRYLLYLLSDGEPVRIRLHFDGLIEGRTTLSSLRPARYQLRTPEPRLLAGPSDNVYSAGANGRLRSSGLLFEVLWLVGSGEPYAEVGTCIHRGRADPETGFLPYCPGAEEAGAGGPFIFVPPENDGFTMATYSLNREGRGAYGLGGWYESASEVLSAGFLAFWLSLG